MSSSRRNLDQYFTPTFAAVELLRYVNPIGSVLECCNGDGGISKGLPGGARIIWTNDIDESWTADFHYDVSVARSWELMKTRGVLQYDWVITNPPFNQAPTIVPFAFQNSRVGIAMLLRASYTEPTFDRQSWLKEHEQHLAYIIYLPHISFTGDGKTDNVSCNWYVWTKERVSGCQLHWVTKEKR